jgi:hypothetical protein
MLGEPVQISNAGPFVRRSRSRRLNLRNARMGAWFVMILVPLCWFLDWMAYPER